MGTIAYRFWVKVVSVVLFYVSAIIFCFSAAIFAYMLDGQLAMSDIEEYEVDALESKYVDDISYQIYSMVAHDYIQSVQIVEYEEIYHNDAIVYYSIHENGIQIGGNYNSVTREVDYMYRRETPYSYEVYVEEILRIGETAEFATDLFTADQLKDMEYLSVTTEGSEAEIENSQETIITEDGIILRVGQQLQGKNGEIYEVMSDGTLYVLESDPYLNFQIVLYFTGEILTQEEITSIENTITLGDVAVPVIDNIIPIMIVTFAIALITFILLMAGAGRKVGVEGVHLNSFDKIPFDILFLIVAFPLLIGLSSYEFLPIIISLVLLLPLLMTFSTRAKARHWWKNTLIFIVPNFLWRVFRGGALKSPMILKFCIALVPMFLIQLVVYGSSDGIVELFVLLWSTFVIFVMFVLISVWATKLKQSTQKLFQGDLDHKIDTSIMAIEFKEIGENINRITDGMNIALEEKMKSEKLKTELITNVSHDIKTPLTSIINYVDLIKKEEIDNEKLEEYTEVLDRQSQKLKRLIIDLVDASKISTGNVEINLEAIDMCVFAEQLAGEYSKRLEEEGLEIVTNFPGVPMVVLADSKHLQRIFDNLMINVLKYSLKSSRVYLDVIDSQNAVTLTLKNTSKEKLNIDPSELMERFVRGDSSRNTEGNGLGLSIAQSLAKAQNINFSIQIDGDLFKIIINLHKYYE